MVDPIMSHHLGSLMLKLKQQLRLTSVVVTHDLELMRRVADNVVFLHHRPKVNHLAFMRIYRNVWRWIGWSMRISMAQVSAFVGYL